MDLNHELGSIDLIQTLDTRQLPPGGGTAGVLTVLGTGGIVIPKGTTAEQPAAMPGLIRFNTDMNVFEFYQGSIPTWVNLGGSTTNGTVTSVDFNGGSTGLTVSGGPVTDSGTFTLDGVLGLSNGGTGASLSPNIGGIPYSTSTDIQILAGTYTANQILLSGSLSAPKWSTSTYPDTIVANGILYGSATNIISQLALGTANQVLSVNGTGDGLVWVTGGGGGGSGTVTSVNVSGGSTGLSFTGGPVTVSGTITMSGTLGLSNGGTNSSLTASNGGIAYSDASSLKILSGTATANKLLMSGSSTAPSWSSATYPATTTANSILYSTASNTVGQLALGTAYQVLRVNSAGTAPAYGAIDLSQSSAATGVLQSASMPALTGDVTNTAGTVATTVSRINGVLLSALATGILKNTTGTGAPSIAVSGVDYAAPSSIVDIQSRIFLLMGA